MSAENLCRQQIGNIGFVMSFCRSNNAEPCLYIIKELHVNNGGNAVWNGDPGSVVFTDVFPIPQNALNASKAETISLHGFISFLVQRADD